MSRSVLFIAGPIGAGKSTLARALSEAAPQTTTSTFSRGLRLLGQREGFALRSRAALQDFGEHVARTRGHELWEATLESAEATGSLNVIVDGLRHAHIFRMVRELPDTTAYLLTLWPTPAEIARRRAARGETEIDESHKVESGIGELAEISDVLLRGRIADEARAENLVSLVEPIWIADLWTSSKH